MWELLTGEEPYADLHYGAIIGKKHSGWIQICDLIISGFQLNWWVVCGVSQIYSGGIVSNTLRPPVPETCDPEWRILMERCWSSEPSERPTFTEIAYELRSIASRISPRGQNSPKRPNQQLQPSSLHTQVHKWFFLNLCFSSNCILCNIYSRKEMIC